MHLSFQSIAVDSLDTTATQWSLHPWQSEELPPELQASLARCGVLHPPLILADPSGILVIVSGRRRIEFIKKHTALSRVDCLIIDKDAPPHFILDLILTEQASAGPLSLAEKAQFMAMASRMSIPQDIQNTFLPKLQLKSGRSTLTNLRKILDQNEIIIREIHDGRMQDRLVSELLSLPEEADRLALTLFFKDLCMGDGQQRKFFNLIRDIAFRQGSSINLFLQQKEIVAILDHQQMNIPQKIQHLGNLLQHALAPASTRAEEAFMQQVKDLQLPTGHSIRHSPSFEKDEVTLSITFRNFAECVHYLAREPKKTKSSTSDDSTAGRTA